MLAWHSNLQCSTFVPSITGVGVAFANLQVVISSGERYSKITGKDVGTSAVLFISVNQRVAPVCESGEKK